LCVLYAGSAFMIEYILPSRILFSRSIARLRSASIWRGRSGAGISESAPGKLRGQRAGGGSGEAARRGGGLTCMRFALYCTCGYDLGERMSIPGFILRNLSTCASWPRCSSRSAVALLLIFICWVDVGSG
jgi:hypothetical protein